MSCRPSVPSFWLPASSPDHSPADRGTVILVRVCSRPRATDSRPTHDSRLTTHP